MCSELFTIGLDLGFHSLFIFQTRCSGVELQRTLGLPGSSYHISNTAGDQSNTGTPKDQLFAISAAQALAQNNLE